MRWQSDAKYQKNIRTITVQCHRSGDGVGDEAQAQGRKEERHWRVGPNVSHSKAHHTAIPKEHQPFD